MTKNFKLTPKQIEQRIKLASAMHVMSFGGSRSGKTFGICRAIIVRALKCKSRHLVVRLKFNHAKTSIWYETFQKVFQIAFPDLKLGRDYFENKSDWFFKLRNGSEIWIGGLDEKQRVEKILGKEYSTIYFNECSQIPWGSVQVALTRLAEKNELVKRAWYDENPPTKRHWSYPLFIKGQDPETWQPITNFSDYANILMNPDSNRENIDDSYIDGILNRLPENQRKRFLLGEFTDDASGNIYHAFDRSRHVKPCPRIDRFVIWIGMDFNVNPLTFTLGQVVPDESGDEDKTKLQIFAEGFLRNSNTPAASQNINRRWPGPWTVIPDSTGSRRQTSAESGQVDHKILRDHGFTVPYVRNPFRMDRYNEVNALFESDRCEIDPSCTNLIADLEQCVFKEGSNEPDTKDPMRGHISDAFGYKVHYLFPLARIETSATMWGER